MCNVFPPSAFSLTKEWAGSFFQNWLVNSANKYLHVPLGGEGGGVISDEEGYKKLAMVAGEGKNDVNNILIYSYRSCIHMGESSKFLKSWTFKTAILKLPVCPLNIHNFKFKWSNVLRPIKTKSEKLLWSPSFCGKSASKSWIQE